MAWEFRNEKWDIKKMLEILEEALEVKERSIAVGNSFDDTFEKNHSTSALQKNSKKITKEPCIVWNRCLKIWELSNRNLFVKYNKLYFLYLGKGNSVKSCSLAYSCNKCKGNCNIAICTYPKDSLNTASATNLSSNSNNILLQTATAAVSNFNFPGSLINAQVTKNPFQKHCSKYPWQFKIYG